MMRNILNQFHGWLRSKTIPWFAPYWEAKKLHEGSPHGLFPRTYYHALRDKEIHDAKQCPRLERAITLYKECIEREKNSGRHFNEGIALHQLGLVLHRQGKLVAARQAYGKAIEILEDLPNPEALPAISTCHFRLSEIHIASGDKQSASLHLERSRKIDESLNDQDGLSLSAELRQKLENNAEELAPRVQGS
jgi:tetratricopeptide (TPR) repeat protein